MFRAKVEKYHAHRLEKNMFTAEEVVPTLGIIVSYLKFGID